MEIRSALDKIIQGQDLSEHEMFATFTQIMSGQATDTQIGALLVAMRMKGETIDVILLAQWVTVQTYLMFPQQPHSL